MSGMLSVMELSSMLKWAGLGIVIGNAPEEVTTAADWVVGTDTKDGFAQAIEKLLDM
jgi:hydroxymethylpyrimidine pyrophosphatase-like HAD family hydrolase